MMGFCVSVYSGGVTVNAYFNKVPWNVGSFSPFSCFSAAPLSLVMRNV